MTERKCEYYCVILLGVFFISFCCAQAALSDVEKIMLKLRGQDALIDPPDPRTVSQIFESISLNDKAKVLTRSVDESLTRKMWDDIMSVENRKELIKAGLSEDKTKELLDVWDKVEDKRDFILKKMDEVSESDTKNEQAFEKFMVEYIKKKNLVVDSMFQFDYRDLNRYTLDYVSETNEPEFVKIKYDDQTDVKFPMGKLPTGLKKIEVDRDYIIYTSKKDGKFYVNSTDVFPTDYMGKEEEWEVKGFKDLEKNEYDVWIHFGEDKNGVLYTVGRKDKDDPTKILAGGFILEKKARVKIDNRYGTVYELIIREEDESSFIVIYDNGVYVFQGDIVTVFNNKGRLFNFSEVAIDDSGVVSDIVGRLKFEDGYFTDSFGNLNSDLVDYESKFISIKDDLLFLDGKIMDGNFDEVMGRRFTINSALGIDYEFVTISGGFHNGHLIEYNSLVFQLGFINSQREGSGASDVLVEGTRLGSSLVDLSGRRGSENQGKGFLEWFSQGLFFIDRYFDYVVRRTILNEKGFFVG
jgi:hypothetical protein